MTLGERILKKRKECGLSQESLGSKLEVSRQTVYKWETDQAVPELPKLIAMAEIFSVKVGWLVAEEESDQKEQAYVEAADRIAAILTQSKAAQSGNEKNDIEIPGGKKTDDVEAGNRERKAVRRIRSFNLVVVAGLLIIIIFGSVKFSELERNYNSLNNAIQNSYVYTQRQIDGITYNIQTALESYNDLTLNSNTWIQECDFENNAITLELSAQPKTYTSGMRAMFHINCDGELYDLEAEGHGDKSFSISAKLPLVDEYDISVEFITGDISESKQITVLYALFTSSFPEYNIVWPIEMSMTEDGTGFISEYCEVMRCNSEYNYMMFMLPESEIDFPEVVSVEVFLCEDGVKIADYQYEPDAYAGNAITNSGDIAGASEFSEKWMYFKRPDNLKLDPDKSYEEHLVVTDEYGRKIEYISSENGTEIINATGS